MSRFFPSTCDPSRSRDTCHASPLQVDEEEEKRKEEEYMRVAREAREAAEAERNAQLAKEAEEKARLEAERCDARGGLEALAAPADMPRVSAP